MTRCGLSTACRRAGVDGRRDCRTGTELARSADSNRPMLRALVSADGHMVRDFPIVPDDADALITAYREAFASCDVVISGGASEVMGSYTDGLARARRGAVFWRLAMKPGRPMAVGSLGNSGCSVCPATRWQPLFVTGCWRHRHSPSWLAAGPRDLRIPVRAALTTGNIRDAPNICGSGCKPMPVARP